MLILATIITAEGERITMNGKCTRTAMEQIIDAAYPGARRVSLIVRRG